jgi:peptide/nickel transport system substrate-binding protein
MFTRTAAKVLGAVLLTAGAISPSLSQTVNVGMAADVTSVDPHYHLYSPNQSIADHVFNRLIERNDQLRLLPGLALSWRPVDELTWEFKLRPNVVFHDGSPFTAEDVAFSIDRVPTVKDSPGPFTVYTKEIASVTIVDPLTIRFKTHRPHALLPNDLSVLPIIPKKLGTGVTTADFNSGKAVIGTGPYKLVKFSRGERIELVRNDAYWGKKPPAQSLVFKILTNDASRVAALLSGDVQVIEAVPVADIKRLSDSQDVAIVQRVSTRLIFLYFDVSRAPSPFVTDSAGKPLDANPLKDLRVRKAMSKAIDRELIRSRLMDGASRPTAQLVIQGLSGYTEALKPESVDVDGAKKLLADAGYPNGFSVILHGPNNRYVQDEQILQTVAQMLGRIGITVKVEAMPAAVFFPRNNRGDFSFSMSGWVPDSGEASSPLRTLLAARNKDKGFGAFNAGGYSNPKMDQLIEKAMETLNDGERDKLLQQAVELAMADQAIAPLHHQVNVWATRKNIRYGGRSDERTYGFDFILQP